VPTEWLSLLYLGYDEAAAEQIFAFAKPVDRIHEP
jgi:hypothetical protein